MSESFVLFRYPADGNRCGVIVTDSDSVERIYSYGNIGEKNGFVFAPFQVADDSPIVVLDNAGQETYDLSELDRLKLTPSFCRTQERNSRGLCSDTSRTDGRQAYHRDFAAFREALEDGMVKKAVLSRSAFVKTDSGTHVVELFRRAAVGNPDSFVALVSTPFTGTWLLATPEILLESDGDMCHTIALAGTRDSSESFPDGDCVAASWDRKNIEEQQYVAKYISHRLAAFSDDVKENGPFTHNAGRVSHLRSDFHFRKSPSVTIGRIVSELHPTPAVCGVPSGKARILIDRCEHNDRRYYSGFCGTVCTDGECRLFVTLRCMSIFSDWCRLYAGGGLLAESDEESEWRETELKMTAMKNCMSDRE